MLREKVIKVLLWYNVLSLGIWLGGTVYQMLVIVPLWSAAPPESVRTFFGGTAYNRTILHFFGPLTQLTRGLPLLLLAGLTWDIPRHRPWLFASASTMLIGLVMTRAYIYPINDVLFTRAGGDLGATAIRALVDRWILADRVRFAIMATGYSCLLKAFGLPL